MKWLSPAVLSAGLVILGICVFGWSTQFEPYKDIAALHEAMMAYPAGIEASGEASRRYWAIREELLTPKFLLQDIGLSAFICAAILYATIRIYRVKRWADFLHIAPPQKYRWVVVIGVCAAFAFTFASAAALFIDFSRQMFPPWADSMGIPLMGLPALLLVGLLFVSLFSLWARRSYQKRNSIIQTFYREYRPSLGWCCVLGLPSAAFLFILFTTTGEADFVFIIPMMLFAVFFVFLLAGHQKGPESKPTSQTSA